MYNKKMASYFPPRASPSSSVRSASDIDTVLSTTKSSEVSDSLSPRSPTLLSQRATMKSSEVSDSLSPRLSPRSPTLLSQRAAMKSSEVSRSISPRSPTLLSQRGDTVRRVGKKMIHDKIKSNDWNLVLDDVLKHIKKHGVTTKLIKSLHEHDWETVHHVLKRALIISSVRWEVRHVMAVFVLLDHVKSKFGSEVEEVKNELKKKVRELIQDEKALEELREHLL